MKNHLKTIAILILAPIGFIVAIAGWLGMFGAADSSPFFMTCTIIDVIAFFGVMYYGVYNSLKNKK
jgi:hypothetical protein